MPATHPRLYVEPLALATPRFRRREWPSRWSGGVGLAVLCLAAYLPGFISIPPVDGHEPRFAAASRRLSASADWRDWVAPDGLKPPLAYWAQAACGRLPGGAADPPQATGEHMLTGGIWVYRLPSLLAAIATVLLTWRVGLRMFDARAAWLGAALLAGCPLVMTSARLAQPDQMLAAFTTLAQLALFRVWRRRRAAAIWALLFWAAAGLSVLAGGLFACMTSAATTIALCLLSGRWGWLSRLRPVLGGMLLIPLAAAWFWLASKAVGWPALLEGLRGSALLNDAAWPTGRWLPPGSHLLLMPLLLWPGSLLAIAAIQRAIQRRRAAADAFLVAWLLPAWLLLEMLPNKSPHDALPLYAALALLAGRATFAAASGRLGLGSGPAAGISLTIWMLIGVIIACLLPAGVAWQGWLKHVPQTSGAVVFAALAALLMLINAWGGLSRRQFVPAMVVGVLVILLAGFNLFQLVAPNLRIAWPAARIAGLVQAADPAGRQRLATVGYSSDSLSYLLRGRVDDVPPTGLSEWFARHRRGLAVIRRDLLDPTRELELAPIDGFDYATGAWVSLALVEPLAASSSPGR